MKQKTVGKKGSLTGLGLHTGCESTVTLVPSEEDTGIVFVRTDLEGSPVIPADIDYIVGNARGTAIGIGDAIVYTIEHLMAALAAFGVSNCRCEVNAEEVPLMDGSAKPFIDLLKETGVEEQNAEQEYIVIDEPMWLYNSGHTALSVFPADQYHITLMIDYNNQFIGTQHTTMFNFEHFADEFAPARTFCFLSEVEKLREVGLIKGADLECACVVQDVEVTPEYAKKLKGLFDRDIKIERGSNGFLNDNQLRFDNELCRHKAVDLVGDLYLLGKPLKGHIVGARTGHAANHELAKKIREHFNEKGDTMSDIKITYEDILNILPHRFPFLLVDGVDSIVPGEKISAYKNVSFNDNFFQGHFPNNPVMPGVLQVEALAQAAGIMAMYGKEVDEDTVVLFMSSDNVKWRKPVRPGDKLVLDVEMKKQRKNIIVCEGTGRVNGDVVCQAELKCMIGAK